MPWEEVSIMDQRREFVRLATQEGANRRELCRRFGIHPDTGYKWIDRWTGSGELADDDAPDEPAPKFERADDRLVATEVLEPVEPGPAVPGHELGHPGRRAAGELEQDQLAARVAALEQRVAEHRARVVRERIGVDRVAQRALAIGLVLRRRLQRCFWISASTLLRGCAPTSWPTTLPPLKMSSVGIDRTPYCCGTI